MRPMRIGIDARELLGNRTGVGRYLAALCAEWQGLPPDGPHEFVLYGHEKKYHKLIAENEELRAELKSIRKIVADLEKHLKDRDH